MSEWKDKSDFEINKAVSNLVDHFELVVFINEAKRLVYLCEQDWYFSVNPVCIFDPCNGSQDSWPIIFKNGIDILSPTTNGTDDWFAGFFDPHSIGGAEDIKIYDKNPLRAAMIVYLEMNGVKP